MNLSEEVDRLLAAHTIIAIVVLPGQCKGLEAFPPAVPLKLNLGHTLAPPMFIQTDADGVTFRASFRGESRLVSVPWAGLCFAGTDAALSQLLKDLAPKPERAPTEGNVVKVDFAKGRRK